MKDIKFVSPKKVEILKVKKVKLKPKPRSFKELELERKLAKAGFKGFY